MNHNKTYSLCRFLIISKLPFSLWLFVVLFTLASCSNILHRDYTVEVNPISCDKMQSLVYPIELNEEGETVHKNQLENIKQSLNKGQIQDAFIFVHGWNNTVQGAQEIYKDFICRFRPFSSHLNNINNAQEITSQNSIA